MVLPKNLINRSAYDNRHLVFTRDKDLRKELFKERTCEELCEFIESNDLNLLVYNMMMNNSIGFRVVSDNCRIVCRDGKYYARFKELKVGDIQIEESLVAEQEDEEFKESLDDIFLPGKKKSRYFPGAVVSYIDPIEKTRVDSFVIPDINLTSTPMEEKKELFLSVSSMLFELLEIDTIHKLVKEINKSIDIADASEKENKS